MTSAAATRLAPDGTLAATPRGAWAVWGLGVFAYIVAVFHRGSLGVAGVEAQERFGATASQLSLFSVLQLAVYAGLQVPVGVMLDRLGPRRMIATGAVVTGCGQLVLATADGVPAAVAARVLVGAGDAMTFISVLRLVPAWFAPSSAPVVTQLTGMLGQLGQVAAAYPLVALLHSAGWTASFTGAAAVSGLVAVLVSAGLRDVPPGTRALPTAPSLAEVRHSLAGAWREPGTRLGLWTHFVTQFSGTVFVLLWGYPYLTVAQGLRPSTAGLLLTLLVGVGMFVGPVLGRLAARWPRRRSILVFTIVGATAAVWTVVLAWPGRAPLPLLVLLVVVLASNGPGSMLGFDYARTENPPERLGSASGIVNVGGFVASLTTIMVVGVVLDVLSSGGPGSYTLDEFRVALCFQYVLWLVGLVGVVRTRRHLRRRLAEAGLVLDPFPSAVLRRLRAR